MLCRIPTTSDTTVVKAGWLLDGLGGPALQNAWFTVCRGKISMVTDNRPPGDYQTIDLSDYTVLPGLVDSHVHLFMSGSRDRNIHRSQINACFDDAKKVISDNIGQHLAHGTVAVRDGGDPMSYALRYKKELMECHAPVFKIRAAGKGWYKRGRYGRIVGGDPLPDDDPVDTVIQWAKSVDHVKLINSGLNSINEFGRQTPPQFAPDELAYIVKGAGSMGVKVMVHANGKKPVRDAVEAGAASVEHGYFMGKDNLLRMADSGVFWVPTVVPMSAYADSSHDRKDVVLRTIDHQLEQIAFARQAGVTVAAGTDAGSPGVSHGDGMIREIELLMSAGFSIEQAIQCATSNGARLAGLDGLGKLAAGAEAVWVAAKGEVSDLPASLRSAVVYCCARIDA